VEPGDRSTWTIHDLRASGVRALTEGLSALPDEFTAASTTPLAYWKSETFGFVTFLAGSPEDGNDFPVWTGCYEWSHGDWVPTSAPWIGRERSREAVAGPWEPPAETMGNNVVSLGGSVLLGHDEEGPAQILWGWCSAAQAQLSIVQIDNRCDISVGHLGSWVVGCQSRDPWTIEARTSDGQLVGLLNQHL
jgi:hypothetical protein